MMTMMTMEAMVDQEVHKVVFAMFYEFFNQSTIVPIVLYCVLNLVYNRNYFAAPLKRN